MYASDEAMEICKKYKYLIQDESGSSIKKFFSSMVNYVHFIGDYERLDEILELEIEYGVETKEEKIGMIAGEMLKYYSGEHFFPEDNFAFNFVWCLDKLEEISKLTYQKYQGKKSKKREKISEEQYKQKQELLKQIYNKYKKYGERFFTPRDAEIMCQERDGISDFQKDFNLVIETLENIGFATKNFKSCVSIFRSDILKEYKKGFEAGTTLEKFTDLGYQKYFSDDQIYNLGITNVFNCESNGICIPKSVIKKLPKITGGGTTQKLDDTSKALYLRPGDKLDYIIASGNSGETCTNTMRKLFWHMDYRKLKTFVSDYSFEDFKNKNTSNDRNIASFGVHLQNILIDAFGYKSFEFKSKKANKKEKDRELEEKIKGIDEKNDLIEYNKISVSQKFIFGECFFGGMFRSICQINKLKKEKEKDEKEANICNIRVYN